MAIISGGLANMLEVQVSEMGSVTVFKVNDSEVGLTHVWNSLLYRKALLSTQLFFKHLFDYIPIRRN
jgi:hypothetical protein